MKKRRKPKRMMRELSVKAETRGKNSTHTQNKIA
jgi:hypothetical protein